MDNCPYSGSIRLYIFMRSIGIVSLCVAFGVLLSGCSSSKKNGHSNSRKEHIVNVRKHKNHHSLGKYQEDIVEEAMSWLGTPYKYAGQEKGRGTDCSGMVMKVYEDVAGWKLPRNSAKQAEFCDRLKEEDVEPGDLVFFATGKDPDKVSHVGIMLDEENFIHASTSKGVVISKVTSNYYIRTFMMYGRIPKSVINTPN